MPKMNDDLMQELLKAFYDEAAEHIETINKSLLQIERGLEAKVHKTHVQNAFRAAHSLKGAARAVSFAKVEGLSDGMESILQLVRDKGFELDPDTCDILYDTLDTIQKMLGGEDVEVDTLQQGLKSVLIEYADSVAPTIEEEPTTPPAVHQETAKAPEPKKAVAPVEDEDSPATPAVTHVSSDETIRVSVGKLDDLLAQVGELLVSRINAEQRLIDARTMQQQLARWSKSWREISSILSHHRQDLGPQMDDLSIRHEAYLRDLMQSMNGFVQAFNRDTVRLSMVTGDLQDKVRRVRMVPFQTISLILERAVRDAAHSEDKQVDFTMTGQDVELDKKILESLKDPLLHLLRNAVSHGIESAEQREKNNKPIRGHISLAVQQRGSEVHIRVNDDGRGFDVEALRATVSQNGRAAALEDASMDELIQLAFLPGVTTASQVTAISGRGVGLDVVNQELEAIQGRIEIENNPGQGVSINLIVPTTLSMTRELLVEVNSEFYGIPLQAVEKIVEPDEMISVSGKTMINLDGATLPLVPLDSILELPQRNRESDKLGFAIVIGIADQRLALLVDNVLTEQELAVKTLDWPLKRVRNISGVALLGDGKPIIILNPTDIVRSANHVHMAASVVSTTDKDTSKPNTHVLVVDDSITTRTLEKNILSAAGFTVTTATNGLEALNKLSEERSVEIVVSDVQMPEMDGITLTRTLRQKPEYTNLPVILVTSLESQEDREQGMTAGADAYIVKRGFDQAELLTTIQKLLVGR